MAAFTDCAGVHVGCAWRTSAAAPATCGAAIDVPLIGRGRVVEAIHADGMLARREQVDARPQFENEARASVVVVAPTVRALGGRGGRVAGVRVVVAGRDRVGHAVGDGGCRGRRRPRQRPAEAHVGDSGLAAAWFAVTQSTPAMTSDVGPVPPAVEDADATSETLLATPYVDRRRCRRRACRGRGSRRRAAVDGVYAVRGAAAELGVREAHAGVDDVGVHAGARRGVR